MKKKQFLITLTVIALCLSCTLFISCSKKDGTTHRGVESVKLDAATKTVQVGDSVTLTVTITPEDAEYKDVLAVSSNAENVASAKLSDKTVTVKGLNPGKSTVTVTANSLSASCEITVEPYTVKLDATDTTIGIGDSFLLSATVSPKEGATAKWTSKDVKIATLVDGGFSAVVVGAGEGETYIYCTVNEKFKDSCKVTVLKAIDLSANGTSNCYIVSTAGIYKFKAVKGNSSESVGTIPSVAVLWESYGTDASISSGELIKADVSYAANYITFTTGSQFPAKKGNAVIAAKDGNGNILWSWHIWLTDQPEEQAYNNSAGTMMDRNLGATSAEKGQVSALGLLYQWGRKDPFLCGDKTYYDSNPKQAASTLSWPSAQAASNCLSGNNTLAYSISHPTTFIKNNSDHPYDWYCTDATHRNDNLWKTSSGKTMYDPCPVGWRVPDGGDSGVWCTAFDYTTYWTTPSNWNATNKGMDFGKTDKKLVGTGSAQCWYPAAGYRHNGDGLLSSVGFCGYYWSCTPNSFDAYGLYFSDNGGVSPSGDDDFRAYGYSVRCLKEK